MTGDAEICKSLWSCFIQGKSPFYFKVHQLLIRTCTLRIFTLSAQARQDLLKLFSTQFSDTVPKINLNSTACTGSVSAITSSCCQAAIDTDLTTSDKLDTPINCILLDNSNSSKQGQKFNVLTTLLPFSCYSCVRKHLCLLQLSLPHLARFAYLQHPQYPHYEVNNFKSNQKDVFLHRE